MKNRHNAGLSFVVSVTLTIAILSFFYSPEINTLALRLWGAILVVIALLTVVSGRMEK